MEQPLHLQRSMMPNTERLENLRRLYVSMVCEQVGEACRTAATTCAAAAHLGRVTYDYSACLPKGTWCLVWDRGETLGGDRALAGWNPVFGLDLFHQAQCYVEVVS